MGDCFRSENLRLVLYCQMVITLESNYKENTHQNRLYGPKNRAHIFLTLVRTELQLKVYQMKDAYVNLPSNFTFGTFNLSRKFEKRINSPGSVSLINFDRSITQWS